MNVFHLPAGREIDGRSELIGFHHFIHEGAMSSFWHALVVLLHTPQPRR